MIDLSEKTIIVSGAGGFIGKRLTAQLIASGAQVIGIDLRPFPSVPPFDSDRFTAIHADIDTAEERIRESVGILDIGALTAFHAAGMSHAGECERYPRRACETNIALTWRFLDLCRVLGTGRFVFLSTGLVYGDNLSAPARETDTLAPPHFYAHTKAAAETIVQGYASSYGLHATILRMSNIYGPGAHPGSLIGMIARHIADGEPIQLMATRPERDYLYIDDAVDGMITAAFRPDQDTTAIFNLSGGTGTSALEAAREACAIGGIVLDTDSADTDAYSYNVLDNTLLTDSTGWRPTTDLAHGLSLTLAGIK